MFQPADLSIKAEARFPGLSLPAMRQVILEDMTSRGMTVLEDSAARISVQSKFGMFDFEVAEDAILVRLAARREVGLQLMRDLLMSRVTDFTPDIAAKIRWSDASQTAKRPPNFRQGVVVSVTQAGPAFLRVRLKIPDLGSFGTDSIHCQILLPPQGVTPDWPYLGENGATVWPKGDRAWHRPAYTIRWMDADAGLVDFDIFIHEGGRATDWARRVRPGDEVAFTGPGGGGIAHCPEILIYADETAFPAAARILETLPANATGKAVFLCEPGAAGTYPMAPVASGVSLRWIERGQGDSLSELALADRQECPDHFLWFASEKSEVQPVRAAYRAGKGDPAKSYIAAYWTRG